MYLLSPPLIRILAYCSFIFIGSTLVSQAGTLRTRSGNHYHQAVVREQTGHSVIIHHSKGIADVPLDELPEDWKKALSSQPPRPDHASSPKTEPSPAPPLLSTLEKPQSTPIRFPLSAGTDLRPLFAEYGLKPKNQGVRSSCTVFSMVAALEYELSRENRIQGPLSEEYLTWATVRYHNKDSGKIAQALTNLQQNSFDTGFTIFEVIMALSQYGIAPEAKMRYKEGERLENIPSPPKEIIQEGKRNRNIRAYWIEAKDNDERIEHILKTLDLKHPVVIGLRWPGDGALSREYQLDQQEGNMQHAVTVVGFKNPTGMKEDIQLIIRNSWGPEWGDEGYGYATYSYLKRNLLAALFISGF